MAKISILPAVNTDLGGGGVSRLEGKKIRYWITKDKLSREESLLRVWSVLLPGKYCQCLETHQSLGRLDGGLGLEVGVPSHPRTLKFYD